MDVMGFTAKMCIKLVVATTLILCVYPDRIVSQDLGCSFESLHLDKCLNQQGEYVFLEPCCRALNQALRVGFHCLCSVFMTDAPQLTTIFSLSLSAGCYIMVPPLTMCRDLGTTPISLPIPPNSPPKEISTAQQTPLVPLPPPPPPQEIGGSLDPNTPNANSTVVEQQQQPHPSKNATSTLHVVENQNNVSSSGVYPLRGCTIIPKTTQGEDDGWRVVSRRKRDPRTPISMNLGFAQVTDDQTRFSFDGGGDLEASPPFQSAGPESGVDPSSTEQFSGSPTPLSPSAEMDLTPIAADILHPPLPGLLLDSYQASSATRISFSTPLSLILSSLHKTLIRWRQWSSCFLEFFSLSSVCPPRQSNFDSLINFSLELFCSDSEASPPLQSAGPESGIDASCTEQFSGSPTPLLPSAEMDLTPIAADILHPAPPGLLLDSSQASSATRISLSTPLSLILSRLGADGAC
ncbi:uncharacterized protein [Spinacia oleracea]|uniref:Uncharacterized protein isoform X2 n=1 Tax=Spinacia oleracea TaxID=3562 RepID=A0ABM3RK34_SPIOL|nr:uncharacterized protein LOC110800060 isoform X2 [Spinacia oleracea]